MKTKVVLLAILSTLVLSGCSLLNPTSTTSSSSTSTSTTVDPSTSMLLDLYCVNDYHGQVSKDINGSIYRGGISRLGTYLNKRIQSNPNGSLFLNAGDLWQDTFDSAKNKGELLTKAMVKLNCEAMALGNHEFDWGQDIIKQNKAIAENENNQVSCNFLGANIYHYEGGKATTQASELCSPYKIVTRGDYKIGIIGAIGEKQLTSITSSLVENITFLDPTSIVKNLSDELKTKQGCDVVIYLFHGSAEQSDFDELSMTSSVSGKHYVDAGFLGHSHQFETVYYNDVPWIQSYEHGAVLGHVQLQLNKSLTNPKCTYYPEYSSQAGYKGRDENGYGFGKDSIYAQEEKSEIKSIVDEYLTPEFVADKNRSVVTLTNHQGSVGKKIGNILAKATSNYIDKLNNPDIPKIDVILNNGNRDEVKVHEDNTLSNEDVFNLNPFTNKTIIASVLGRDIYSECIRYSNPYYLPGEESLTIDQSKYYNVACIDYLMLHKNTRREYDYFSSYKGAIYTIDLFCHDILLDYFNDYSTFDMSTLNDVAFTGLK